MTEMDPPAMLHSPLDPPEVALAMHLKTCVPALSRLSTHSSEGEKLLQGQRCGVDPPAAVPSARRRSSKSSKSSKSKPTSQSKDTDQDELATCPLFLRKIAKLIDEEEWRELDSFLRLSADATAHHLLAPTSAHETSEGNESNNDTHGVIQSVELCDSTEIYTHTQICNMNIVHYACRFNPPRRILRRLFALYPEGATRPDVLGRLPLHHAAKCSASESLINYLINKDPPAASIIDAHGKTPLIHLCENYSSTTKNGKACSMMEATRALIKAAPSTVNLNDSTDTSALEYAIMSNSPHDVVKYIQGKSARDWKNRQKASMPGKDSHNLVEEELVREHRQKQRTQDDWQHQLQRKQTYARTA